MYESASAQGVVGDRYFDPAPVACYVSYDGWGAAPSRGDFIPAGKNVQIRQVGDCNGGYFTTVIRTRGWWDELVEHVISGSSTIDNPTPNFALCQRCYYYLKFWLDMSTLPAPFNNRPQSFAGELYELVNSRTAHRGTLFRVEGRGTKHLARAIDAGLRDEQLIPAILQDCRVWMFMRPDEWPTPSPSAEPFAFESMMLPSTPSPAIGNLPNELSLPIMHDLPIFDLLSCQWILPVHGLLNEDERAFKAMRGKQRGSGSSRRERRAHEEGTIKADNFPDDFGLELPYVIVRAGLLGVGFNDEQEAFVGHGEAVREAMAELPSEWMGG
ncbi:hypothetical protein BDW22DRAFT_1346780 [Trametopsis cervina]|nr:hypothetical protein BDW22DRAFT_1346780 [Trametopsis cervina]